MDDQQSSPFLDLYKEKGIEVLHISSPLDTTLMSALERKKTEIQFQRIDGDIDDSILDESKSNTDVDEDGKTKASKLSELIQEKLGTDKVKVEAKSLASETLPGFIVVNEDMRRMKEYMALSKQTMPLDFFDKKKFVVNTNSKLINSLPELNAKDPELAKDLITQVYELSLLSQRELDPSKLSEFILRSNRVLEKLVK